MWTSNDRTMQVPVPPGYKRNAQREQFMAQNGFGWIAMIAENQQIMCDMSLLVFPRNVQTFNQAENTIDRYMNMGGVELEVEKRVPIKYGNGQALHAWGIGKMQNGQRIAWETIIVPTQSGVRGFWMQSYQGNRNRFKQARDLVVSRMRIQGVTPGAGGSAGGDGPAKPNGNNVAWKDPQGRFSLQYPRSYQINRQAMQNYAQQRHRTSCRSWRSISQAGAATSS